MNLAERAKAAATTLKQRRDRKLARAAKACFCDAAGELTLEGGQILADLREQAKLFNSGIRIDANGAIEPLELVRMEGRREIVLRLINLLGADPQRVARLVEVDDGRD